MKKLFLVIIIIIIIISLGAAVVMGIVPGVSTALGLGPKDLGIKITEADSKLARDKVGTEIIALPKDTDPSKDFVLEGKKDANFEMDSKELTAHSNNRPWKNYPVKNLQIRIHDDGTIESSATLIVAKALPYAMGLGYSESQIKEAMQKYNIPQVEVPFYVIGKGSVKNDKVSVNASEVKIGPVTIPNNIVSQANKEAERVLDDLISKNSQAFHAESVTFDKGKMNFVGQVPIKEYVVTE